MTGITLNPKIEVLLNINERNFVILDRGYFSVSTRFLLTISVCY